MKKPAAIEPWKPAPYDEADTYAIKALAAGVANEGQQKRALKWIIESLCGTYDLSFRPGPEGDRDTAFAEGRRSVGLQLVKQINLVLKQQ
jgi:hypothetical protein